MLTTASPHRRFHPADDRCSIPSDGSGIGWPRDEEIICAAMYEHYTGRSITASIAKAPGAVIPPSFIRAIFDYPFVQLGCTKILAYIEDTNWKSGDWSRRWGSGKRQLFPMCFHRGT